MAEVEQSGGPDKTVENRVSKTAKRLGLILFIASQPFNAFSWGFKKVEECLQARREKDMEERVKNGQSG